MKNIKIKHFVKEQSLFILLTLVLIGFIISLFLFFIPKIKEYFVLKKQIQQQEIKLQKLTEKYTLLNSLSPQDLKEKYDLLVKAMPIQKDFVPLILNIKKIYQEEGLLSPEFQFSLGDVSTQSAVVSKSKNSVKSNSYLVKLKIVGNFEGIQKMLTRLENSLPLVSIDSFKISSSSVSSSSPSATLDISSLYEGTLSLNSFYSLLPKSLGKIEDSLPSVPSSQKQLVEKLSGYEYTLEENLSGVNEIVVGRENPF